MLDVAQLVERATLWLLRSGLPLDLRARVAQFGPGIALLGERLPDILPSTEADTMTSRIAALVGRGVPIALATRVVRLDFLVSSGDIVRLAEESHCDLIETGRTYFAVGARLGLDRLRAAAENLRPDSNWQKMAIGALIDDFFQHQTELTRKVLGQSAGPAPLAGHAAVIAPLDAVLAEIRAAPA